MIRSAKPMSRNLIAILRGIQTHEVEAVTDILINAGITKIEVPLNSPNPFDSIEVIIKRFGDVAEIGAGTVVNKRQHGFVHL